MPNTKSPADLASASVGPAGATGTAASAASRAVSVTATGPIRHGAKVDGEMVFRDFAEGESFDVSDQKAADALVAAGGVIMTATGSKATDDQLAPQKAGDAEAIDKANAKADAERGKTAAKEARDLG